MALTSVFYVLGVDLKLWMSGWPFSIDMQDSTGLVH